MSGMHDSTAVVLVQEHSAKGFNLQSFRTRVDAAMHLIRSELCRADFPEDVVVAVRNEIQLMIIQYEIEMPEQEPKPE
ncbi:hypothetical protein G169_gp44 [Pseudomonas phage AF]|uniref:hypothetical protein n=1 Tax=Pseudomonas phage AF TaxID=1235689 RepID=UPI00029713A7|nr:hypothetical protein G169_gp44 [Pseudomonas phage AF]AFV50657.1 hypothetical protein AF_044 [Pseudomonas phage AF]